MISQLPLHGQTWIDAMSRVDDPRPMFEKPTTNVRFISGSYFDAMGIRLAGGRSFRPGDKGDSVVVISATVARVLWPREEAGGQTLVLEDRPFRVIGVAGDTRAVVDKSAPSFVYIPYWDASKGMEADLSVVLQTSVPTHDAATVLRRAVARLDGGVAISHFETFGEVLRDTGQERRFQIVLVGGFALAALLVAALGILITGLAILLVGVVALGPILLFLTMCIAGLANGITMPSRDMIVREVTPPGSFGKVFGFVTTGFNIGGIISPLIFGALMDHGNPRAVFLLVAASCLLTIIELVAGHRPRPAT